MASKTFMDDYDLPNGVYEVCYDGCGFGIYDPDGRDIYYASCFDDLKAWTDKMMAAARELEAEVRGRGAEAAPGHFSAEDIPVASIALHALVSANTPNNVSVLAQALFESAMALRGEE